MEIALENGLSINFEQPVVDAGSMQLMDRHIIHSVLVFYFGVEMFILMLLDLILF